MAWNDGSSLPTERADTTATANAPNAPTFHNNEDYLLAGEVDIDESLSRTDTDGTAYLRPFSRVHLASKLNIIAAPTLCVYHIEKGKMLDWNVRMARIKPGQDAETWERWVKGEPAKSFGLQGEFTRRLSPQMRWSRSAALQDHLESACLPSAQTPTFCKDCSVLTCSMLCFH